MCLNNTDCNGYKFMAKVCHNYENVLKVAQNASSNIYLIVNWDAEYDSSLLDIDVSWLNLSKAGDKSNNSLWCVIKYINIY